MTGILMAVLGAAGGAIAPVNTVAPAVTGTATVGQTLSCSTGTWTGTPTPSYTYQWQYGAGNTNISGATSSTYVIASAYVGQTIRCLVTATNSAGAASAPSNSTSAVSATVPTAPTIGTVSYNTTTSLIVGYSAPSSDGGATITSYTAVSTPGGLTGSVSQSGSGTITVNGLTKGTSYTFVVYATNSVGNSPNSAASSAKIASTAPAAPTIGTATATGTTTATVAFTPGDNGGQAVTSYRATSTPGGITATGASSPISVTGLTSGTSYTFTVSALNPVGRSSESAASNAIVPFVGGYILYSAVSGSYYTAQLRVTSAGVLYIATPNWGSAIGGYSYYTFIINSSGTITTQRGQNTAGAEVPYGITPSLSASGELTMVGRATYPPYTMTADMTSMYRITGLAASTNAGGGRDSSGNIYTGWKQSTSPAVCRVAKYTSASPPVLTWGYEYTGITFGTAYTGGYDINDTTGYSLMRLTNNVLILLDSAGTQLFSKQETYGSNCSGGLIDDANNVYVVLSGRLVKLDSSGATLWAKSGAQFGDVGSNQLCVDSSNNVYICGNDSTTGVNRNYIMKFNSSGVLQWQRIFSINQVDGLGTPGALVTDGTYFYISIVSNASAPRSFIVFKLPVSGVGQQTFTINGYSYTYADGAKVVTNSSSGLNAYTATRSAYAPSLTKSTTTTNATAISWTARSI